MLNFPAKTVLKLTVGAALALTMAACGGDGAVTDPKAIVQAGDSAKLTVFTTPGMTIFGAGVAENPDGKEILTIPDPNLGTKTLAIKSRDNAGNIQTIQSDYFSGITSLLGNRVGMLCAPDKRSIRAMYFAGTLPTGIIYNPAEDKGSYHNGEHIYISDDFVEVDPREILGKTFKDYSHCQADGHYFIDENGMITDLDEPLARKKSMNWQSFTKEGRKVGHNISSVIDRTKVYKYSANGKTTYAQVGVVSIDPDVPEANPEEQSVYLSISQ